MRKRKKALLILALVLVLLSGSVIYIVLAPGRWTREIVQYVNQSLMSDSGWNLSIGNLEGQLISDIHLENIYLRNNDGSLVFFCETSALNLDFSQIITGNWALSNLVLDNVLITLKEAEEEIDLDMKFMERLGYNGLRVKSLSVNQSSILVKEGLNEKLYSFEASGRLQPDGEAVSFHVSHAMVHDFQTDSQLDLESGKLRLGASQASASNISAVFNGYQISLDGDVQFSPKTDLSMELSIQNIDLTEFKSWQLPDIFDAQNADLHIEIKSDLTQVYVEGRLDESATSTLIADIETHFEIDNGVYRLFDSEIDINEARFSGTGTWEEDSNLSLDLYVSDLDLSEFGLSAKKTNIQGTTKINLALSDANDLFDVTAKVALQNDNFGSAEFLAVSGRIDYSNGIVSFPDSLTINMGLGTLQAKGNVDLEREKTDLVFVLQETSLPVFASFAGLEGSPDGVTYGTVELSGFIDDPSVKGNLTIRKASFRDIEISSLKSNFMINSIFKTRHGSLAAEAGNTIFGNVNVDGASLNLYFMGDTVLIASADVESGDENLRLSGKIVEFQSLEVDQLQSSLQGQFVSSLEPFFVSRNNNQFKIGPVRLKINEGLLETILTFKEGILEEGHFSAINIDLDGVSKLFNQPLPITGSAFAEFTASTSSEQLSFAGSFQIRDGIWEGFAFDDLLFTAALEGDQVTLKEMQLRRGQDIVLDISGFYTVEVGTDQFLAAKSDGLLSFSSSFRELDLKLLSPYFPGWWALEGEATGSFAMSGTSESSEIGFSFSVTDPRFSLIEAQQISATGRYIDHRLYFEDLVGLTKTGEYTGEGYLPVDLEVVPKDEDRWIESDPIAMQFTLRTSSMDFLSPYFTEIDSITGDIEIALQIEGTPEKPVRNGSIDILDGKVYYTWLDIPIAGISGNAYLKDNMLIVDRLTATSNIPDDTNWGQDLRSNLAKISGGRLFGEKKEKFRDNLRITGTMDMTHFFNPNLAFLVDGSDVYVRTLLGEIEGIADLDLSVTGKDTVTIAGDIVSNEAVLRMEFTGGEDYGEIPTEDGTVFNYRINFPIGDKLFIQNSQIDAEVSGNMSIQKLGNDPYRYAGELDVVEGKFYYYSDVFNIEEGHLAFDPTELNPKLDIRATTDISGEQILVSLTGELDDPVLVLEHSENFFSQEDLLQLLTLQRRFDDEVTGNIGRQSAFLFGRFLENELEKNLARSNPLFDEFEIEGSSTLIDPTDESNLAVKVGTRLTSNLSLSYKRSFSLVQPNQLGVEYRLNRNVSLMVTYDEDGQVHLKYRRKYRF